MSPRPARFGSSRIRVAAAVTVTAAAIGCAEGAGAGGAGGLQLRGGAAAAPSGSMAAAPVPHPDPLPTAAVDPARFPANEPARFRAAGPTFFAAPGGNDAGPGTLAAPFATIRRAIAAAEAAPGGAVVVRSGIYAEGVPTDPRALAIAADGLILRTAAGERATITPGGSARNGLAIAASHVSVSGITFSGFADSGISIGTRARPVADIVLADVAVDMPRGGDGIAIYPDMTGSGQAAVTGLLLDRVSIRGADQGFTVSFGPVRDVALRAVSIRGRGAGAGGGSGIDVASGDDILVNGAEIAGIGGAAVNLRASRAAVVNAYIHDAGGYGVQLYEGGDIVGALIHDCAQDASISLVHGGAGVRYRIAASMVAFHNRRAGGAPAYVLAAGYDYPQEPIELEIAGTVFYRNAGGLVLSQGTHATVRGSAFLEAANGAVVEYGWDGSTSAAIDATGTPADLAALGSASGNLDFAADARLADPNATSIAGFRPEPGSALIDAAATSAPAPAVDLLGAPRVRGRGADAGPIESR